MTVASGLPRPQRRLWELLTGTRVAPIATRWHKLAALEKSWPAVFARPPRRIYQLDYLAQDNLAQFVAQVSAGKRSAPALLNKLVYGEDELGLTVLSELVSVYLLRLATRRWVLLLEPMPGTSSPGMLPVPSRRLLLLLLLSRKTILR
jgi:hypothetical protein